MQELIEMFNSNPVLQTIFGVTGAGIITFWIKDVPTKVFYWLKRRLILRVDFEQGNKIQQYIPTWLEKEYPNKNFRTLFSTSGDFSNGKNILSGGIGSHYIMYKGWFYKITISMDNSNTHEVRKQWDDTRLKYSISTIDFSNNKIKNLVSILESEYNKYQIMGNAPMYHIIDRSMSRLMTIMPVQYRPLSTVYLDQELRKRIIDKITWFIDNEQWYNSRGINYKIAILLYGPPGTGKSTLIKSLAYEFQYNITYANPQNLNEGTRISPPRTFYVLEDFDCDASITNRKNEKSPSTKSVTEIVSELTTPNMLSNILNTLDGGLTKPGSIFILTTNHIDKIDEALKRPGRIDMLIEMGYVTIDVLKQFIDNFFPDNNIILDDFNIKENITISELQEIFMDYRSIDKILEYSVTKKKTSIVV